MSNQDDTFVLVEYERIPTTASDDTAVAAGYREVMVRIIRTYLSNSRACEDMELLDDVCKRGIYRVISACHVDN